MSEQIDHLGRMMVAWNFIEEWIQTNAPELKQKLYPGATEEQIQQAEAEIGVRLPEDLRACWLLHNGTAGFFFGGWGFYPLAHIVQSFRIDAESGIGPLPESPSLPDSVWIPFANDGAGGYLYAEASTTNKQHGLIIEYFPESGNRVVASDLWLLLAAFVNDLEDGEYEVDEYGNLSSDEISFID